MYLDAHRYTAIAVHRNTSGLYYLTLITGEVTCEFHSDEKFLHDFPFALPTYPLRRAIRLYNESGLARNEKTQKIITRLLLTL